MTAADDPTDAPFKRLEIWHNILWSRYKGQVFSELADICESHHVDLIVYQIAETELDRKSLSPVDTSIHNYPYRLLFPGSYSDSSVVARITSCGFRSLVTRADFTILAGYNRVEYWVQAVILRLRRKSVGVFCDSTMHDNTQTLLRYLFKRLFFSMMDSSFCYGQRSRDYVLFHGMRRKDVFVRCQAAWLPASYNPSEIPERRVAALSRNVRTRLLYVGRIAAEKNLFTLLLALTLLPPHINYELVIVGSGECEEATKLRVSELGLSDTVLFTGPLSGEGLYAEYLRAAVLVLPSKSEPWGLVVNESLSFGCPAIVSTQCGCVPELVVDGVTGFSFEFDDADDFAAKIVAMSDKVRSDPREVAIDCLRQIAPFTPEKAGSSIYQGAKASVRKAAAKGSRLS